jgi:hypothetical protein
MLCIAGAPPANRSFAGRHPGVDRSSQFNSRSVVLNGLFAIK